MTAEIAILNKSAVALAADSAVTISAGSKEEKIFDSADKLFELSNKNPIGIMIFNGMSFMEAPLPSLIRLFRAQCSPVKKVEDAAKSFLEFLDRFGKDAPRVVKDRSIEAIFEAVVQAILKRFMEKFQSRVMEKNTQSGDIKAVFEPLLSDTIGVFEHVYQQQAHAKFIGGADFEISADTEQILKKIVEADLAMANSEQKARVVNIGKILLKSDLLSGGRTGVVIAGFGSTDLFPTLVSYELDGMVCDRLKFVQTNCVDIDRKGPKAQVIPFAQKEMVERFLYGLDEQIQSQVTQFCKETVSEVRKVVLEQIDFENVADRNAIEVSAQSAEAAFIKGLDDIAFDKIRSQSRSEIEDMVEFMPKPEMAKMAEALVNLTSIKRRVSRGMETVGGPIDVAVISQSEGFVWIKRKHYFPSDLNARYFNRLDRKSNERQEDENGPTSKSRRVGTARGGKKDETARRKTNVPRPSEGGEDDT
jgi:hypothetical protein